MNFFAASELKHNKSAVHGPIIYISPYEDNCYHYSLSYDVLYK